MDNLKMKQIVAVVIIIIGIVLVYIGISTKIPGTYLTTYSVLDGKENYSSIDEYVGGDAYNYIIGASLIAGRIAGATIVKAVYTGFGLLIISIGLIYGASVFNLKKKKIAQAQTVKEDSVQTLAITEVLSTAQKTTEDSVKEQQRVTDQESPVSEIIEKEQADETK